MKKTKELETVQKILLPLGREQKQKFLDNSNLNDREIELLSFRFIQGKSLKECSLNFGIEEDSVNKAQLRAIKKLFIYIKNN